ncbi:hypothetical protein I6F14_23615 [Bradyrhizobium sp. IC3069]|uniref:hypothetical protein n=1 Tax=unclassified Bradyrhizobium TaxID=2631580 RepID=UPI001CD327E4|nr:MULTISPECIES: hypothetical protein [unclassified Bradyrhizobium]MCA1363396.1 hypothetical protein [Bradyrhizobium sp. IC4059]MCA1520934.1 hypothetical protein [Bradyrhizobium sp. IC3069]
MMFFGAANAGGVPALELVMQITQTSTRNVNWIANAGQSSVIDGAGRFTALNKSPIIVDAPRADIFSRETLLGAEKTVKLSNDLSECVGDLAKTPGLMTRDIVYCMIAQP